MNHPFVGQIKTRSDERGSKFQRCKWLAVLLQLFACCRVNGSSYSRPRRRFAFAELTMASTSGCLTIFPMTTSIFIGLLQEVLLTQILLQDFGELVPLQLILFAAYRSPPICHKCSCHLNGFPCNLVAG